MEIQPLNLFHSLRSIGLPLGAFFKKGPQSFLKQRKTSGKTRPGSIRLETLEDRSVPATLYVDLPANYTVTFDTFPDGFSNGDTVTWNGPSKVANLVVGTSAFSTVSSALGKASASDLIRVAAATYTDGNLQVGPNNLTVEAPTGTQGFSLELGNNTSTQLTLSGAGNIDAKGNQYSNTLIGNDGNNLLNAEYNVADALRLNPAVAVSIPTTGSGTSVTAMSPGRLTSGSDNYHVFRLRNGNSSAVSVSAKLSTGLVVFSGSLPARTDTFVAAKTNSTFSAVTLTGSGITGFPKASGSSTSPFSYEDGGDDTLRGNGGNDILRGGLGIDTAVYSGPRSAYAITLDGAVATVRDTRTGSPDGTDTLHGMERIQFSDQTVRIVPSEFSITAGKSTNLVFYPNTLYGLSTPTTSVSISIDGRTSDGVLVATSGLGVTVTGSGTNNLNLSGSPSAINTFLSTAGQIQYNATTSETRNLTLNPSDGLNVQGFSKLGATGVAPSITSPNTLTVTYGESVNFTVSASGTPAATMKIAPNELPQGIKFDGSTGLMTGSAKAGTYKFNITATNGFGSDATQAFTLVVNKAPLKIIADDQRKGVGTANPRLTVTYEGLVNGDNPSAEVKSLVVTTTALTNSPAGTYPITPAGATSDNYDITYVNGTLTIGVRPTITSPNRTTFTYGTPGTFQVVATGTADIVFSLAAGRLPDGVTLDSKTGVISGTPRPGTIGVFNFTISASNGISPNANQVFNLQVNRANLTIRANNASKVYGQNVNLAGNGYTVTGLLGSDRVNSVTLTSFGTRATAPAGTYSIAASQASGVNLANYNIIYTNGTLTVEKAALTIKANDLTKTYGNAFNLVQTQYTVTGLVNNERLSGLRLTAAGGTAASAPVGTYAIVPSGATGGSLSNYNITYVNGSLTVNKAQLTITANNRRKSEGASVVFGGNEFSVSGLRNKDTVETVTIESKGALAEVGPGTYPIEVTEAVGEGLENYNIKYVAGVMTVLEKVDWSALFGVGTYFTDAKGVISIDFLYDGGGFVGEMGIYSLAGMDGFKVGSTDYIKEAVRRVLTNSGEGRVLISDINEGARTSVKLQTDNQFNKGVYRGVKEFQLDGDSEYGLILVPNTNFQEVLGNPGVGGSKRPLFSHSPLNPSVRINRGVQLSDLTGEGSVFAWEDTRLDDKLCDFDYNDIIFRILGAKAEQTDYQTVAAPLEDITKDPNFKEIIA